MERSIAWKELVPVLMAARNMVRVGIDNISCVHMINCDPSRPADCQKLLEELSYLESCFQFMLVAHWVPRLFNDRAF